MTDSPNPIRSIQSADLESTIAETSGLLVLDFWAPWCGTCVEMLAMIDGLIPEFDKRVHFAKFNVDDDPAQTVAMGVRGVPTIVIFRDGVELDRLIGTESEAEFRARLGRLLGPDRVG